MATRSKSDKESNAVKQGDGPGGQASGIAAKFTEHLKKDETVLEKETLVLRCELNKPNLAVTWLKNGQLIQNSSRIQIWGKQCGHELVIGDVSKADTGDYECVCSKEKTKCNVTVNELPVQFTKPLRNQKLFENATLKLRCQLSKPDVAVKWFKDRQEIRKQNGIEVSSDGCYHELVIADVSISDGGSYNCQHENGESSCTVKVTELPAEFTKRLEDDVVKEWDILKLRCVLNKPDKSVKWSKDGIPIKTDGRIKVTNDQCEHKLVIEDVSKEDAGRYEVACKAGYTECNVKVKELPVQFTKALISHTVKVKETLILTCELNRFDVQVNWLKEDNVVEKDKRINVKVDQNIHQLVITDSTKEDSAEYKCVCRDMKTSCSITVEDIPSKWSGWLMWAVFVVVFGSLIRYVINSNSEFVTSDMKTSVLHVKKIDSLMRRVQDIDEDVLLMKNQSTGVKNDTFDMLSKLETEVEKDRETLRNINSEIGKITSSISEKANEMDLNKMSSEFLSSLKKMEEKFIEDITQIKESLEEKMQNFDQFKTEFEKEFNETTDSLHKFEIETKENLGKVNVALSDIEEKTADLKEMFAEVAEQLKLIKTAKEEADAILTRIKNDVARIMPNTFNKEALTTAFLVLIVFVFLLAFWIYRVQTMLTPGGLERSQSMNAADVLQQIPTRVSLSNSICIISFDEARQAAHEALVTSAFMNVGNVKMEYFVVRRHEHLLRLPKCKFFIMCTEFSERHVIIEEPGLGLGDLKRCTYEAIQRYGAQMIILYTRDPGSRTLGDQLYNHRIHCVSAQPELIGLRGRDRFLSTYDKLTDLQKRSLNDTIKQCLQ